MEIWAAAKHPRIHKLQRTKLPKIFHDVEVGNCLQVEKTMNPWIDAGTFRRKRQVSCPISQWRTTPSRIITCGIKDGW